MKSLRHLLTIIAFVSLLAVAQTAQAHPHIFITITPKIETDKDGVRELVIEWSFDDMLSHTLAGECDANGDWKIDAQELKTVEELFIPFYAKSYFHAEMTNQKGEALPLELSFEGMEFRNRIVIFKLKTPLPLAFGETAQIFSLTFEDEEYMVAYEYSEIATMAVSGEGAEQVSFSKGSHGALIHINLAARAAGDVATAPAAPVVVASGVAQDEGLIRGILLKMKRGLRSYQFKCNKLINNLTATINFEFSLYAAIMLFLMAVAYGIVHSAGPGHGKTLVIGYFLKNRATLKQAPLFALIISLCHTGSALLMALLFNSILSSYRGMARYEIQAKISFIFALAILALGLWLLKCALFNRACGCEVDEEELLKKKRGMWQIGIAAGCIPCPLSVTILLAGIASGFFKLSFITVCGIATGTFLMLSVAGLITIKASHKLRGWSDKREDGSGKLDRVLDVGGAAMITAFGMGLVFLYMPSGFLG